MGITPTQVVWKATAPMAHYGSWSGVLGTRLLGTPGNHVCLRNIEAHRACGTLQGKLALERYIRKKYVLDQTRSAYHAWPALLQNGLNSNPKPTPDAAGVVGLQLVDSSRKTSRKGQRGQGDIPMSTPRAVGAGPVEQDIVANAG
jgi:hypothetical protein